MFSGVSALNLCLPNCTWAGDMDIDMLPWDAGTDDGIAFLVGSYISVALECGNSNVECLIRNRENSGSNPPFATVLKFGHFRLLHDVSVHSAV